jgi:hypothetical protein
VKAFAIPFEVLAAVCGRITKEASPIRIARLKTNCGQAKSMQKALKALTKGADTKGADKKALTKGADRRTKGAEKALTDGKGADRRTEKALTDGKRR